MKHDDPVFPMTTTHSSSLEEIITLYEPGLTKREMLAAVALHALVGRLSRKALRKGDAALTYAILAEDAVGVADAMIQELAEQEGYANGDTPILSRKTT